MTTPEDTFRALKKPSVYEMQELYAAMDWPFSTKERDAYFQKHGWDFSEFIIKWYRIKQKIPR